MAATGRTRAPNPLMVRSVAKPRVSNHAQAAWPRLDHASFETPAARAPQDEGANKAVARIVRSELREEHAKRNPRRAGKRSFAHLILRNRPQVGVSKDAWFETRRCATLLTMRERVF